MRTRLVAVMTTLLAVMVGATAAAGPSAGAVAAPSGGPAGVGRLPSAKVPLPPGTVTVSPTAQTPDRKPAGTNDADDAAFWIHPTDPSKSLILGTVKEAGLDVYRPDGTLVQTVAAGGGRYNNVDLVHGVTLGPGPARDLAVVTDRKTDKLHIFAVDGAINPPVTEVTAAGVPLLFGSAKPVKSKTAYGVAAWRNLAGVVEMFATQENTVNLARFTLTDAGGGKVSYHRTASYSFPISFTVGGSIWTPCFNPSHPDWQAHAEGMVVDPATGTLWADQELVGIWKLTTELTSPQLVHKLKRFGQTYSVSNGKCSINAGSTSYGDSYLAGDVEGIGLYQAGTTRTATSSCPTRAHRSSPSSTATADVPRRVQGRHRRCHRRRRPDGRGGGHQPPARVRLPVRHAHHAGRQGHAGGRHELQAHAVADGGPGARADDRHERRPALITAAAAAPLGPTMRTSLAGR